MAAIHKSSHWLNFNDVSLIQWMYVRFSTKISQFVLIRQTMAAAMDIFFCRLDETLKIFPSKTTGTNALLHSTTEVCM